MLNLQKSFQTRKINDFRNELLTLKWSPRTLKYGKLIIIMSHVTFVKDGAVIIITYDNRCNNTNNNIISKFFTTVV